MSLLQKNLLKGKIGHTPNALIISDNQNNENNENNEILEEILEEILDEEEEEGKSGISTMSTTTLNHNVPLFIMHHGAGSSGLSFALCSSHIKRLMDNKCTIFSYDCRDDNDLSLERLSQDLVDVLKAAFDDEVVKKRCVVSHVASKRLVPSMTCLAVIDVVEGSALEALKGMLPFLRNRSTEFKSIEDAIEWSINSGTVHNPESARISTFPLLIEKIENKESTHDEGVNKYVWRTDLVTTQKYWEEWFTGLSEKFLSARAAKLLILAGTDRLDKPLTIAQMQESGHMIQEDAPEKTASTLTDFWKRNEKLILPVKKL
ncbi:10416_t:CDS:2 [Diversispora eburnea]|uniref:Protein phosphatase methylesterase 1 n=1 Tax=Diversispora eburnea TaxID=1213867 RepID=A0A9N8YMC2_9GLOM|nr:10416_t:CDS:2 [Diversispora eburnea]